MTEGVGTTQRLAIAALFVATTVVAVGWNLGGPPVTDIMEVRNLVTAREMADTGRWVVPTMNGTWRFEKPPLPTWLAAFAGLSGGFRNLWALRAPATLLALVGAVAVAMYSRKLGATRTGAAAAGLVLLTTFMYAREARIATWELPAHAFTMAAIAALVTCQSRAGVMLAAACLSASFLSKGPVAWGLMLLPWAVTARCWNRSLLRLTMPRLAALVLSTVLLSAAWPVVVAWQAPAHAAAVALREGGTLGSRHVRPAWFYAGFPGFAGVWLPLVLAVLASPVAYRSFFSRPQVRATYAWMCLTLVMLTIVPMKKDRYAIPALFPLAVLVGLWLDTEGRRLTRPVVHVLRAQAGFAAVVGLTALGVVTALALRGVADGTEVSIAVGLVLVGLATSGLALRQSGPLAVRVFVATLATTATVLAAGWQLSDRLLPRQGPPPELRDVGRVNGVPDAHFFASTPDDLFLVWTVGCPLRALPNGRADVVALAGGLASTDARLAVDPGNSVAVRAGWLSTTRPAEDPSIARLSAEGVVVDVDARGSWSSGAASPPLHHSRVVFLFPR